MVVVVVVVVVGTSIRNTKQGHHARYVVDILICGASKAIQSSCARNRCTTDLRWYRWNR